MIRSIILLVFAVLISTGCEKEMMPSSFNTIKYIKQMKEFNGNVVFTWDYYYNTNNKVSTYTVTTTTIENSIETIRKIDTYDYNYLNDTTFIYFNGVIRNKYYKIDESKTYGEFHYEGQLNSYWETEYNDCGIEKSITYTPDGLEKNTSYYIYTDCFDYQIDFYVNGIKEGKTIMKLDQYPNVFQAIIFTVLPDDQIKIGNQLEVESISIDVINNIETIEHQHSSQYEYDKDGYPESRTITFIDGQVKRREYIYY